MEGDDGIRPEDGWVDVRKRPVVIQARKVEERTEVETNHGTAVAEPGDYILEGPDGERYPHSGETFRDRYEVVAGD